MANVIDAATENKVYASFDIVKSEENEDGNLVVYGKATDGSVDTDQQIVDPEWSAKAIKDWLNDGGTLRVQHNPKFLPAGKGLEVETTPNGHFVKALVVEPVAQRLVKYGALRAFSVGIAHPVIERDLSGKARGGIIKGNERTSICEISLVDSPANKNCGFTLVKSENNDSDWEFGDLNALLEKSTTTHVGKGAQLEDRSDADHAGDVERESEEGDESDPDNDTPEGGASKSDSPEAAWRLERHAWLGREPQRGGAADGTEFLAKRAAWQRWWGEGEAQGLTDDGYPTWLGKRKMDPDVGGGVDRDKIPAADFAGRNRSFPIVTPGDVSDAASSIGRAGSDNYSSEQLKSNIIRIARRKGSAFMEELPEAWKNPDSSKAKKPAFEGASKPFDGQDDDGDGKDADKPMDSDGKKKTEKAGSKTCSDCGKVYHADSKVKFCKKCGTKLPGGAAKNADVVKERDLPTDTKPAGRHREPDGSSTIEQLEPEAGLPTDKDPVADKVPASVSGKGASYALQRAHDALCAVYHVDDVAGAYPALKSFTDAVDPAWFDQLAEKAGDENEERTLRALADEAQAIKNEDPDLVADARASLHKSFTEMYPTVSIKPGMDAVQPGKFNRPYISAGHAPLNAGSGGPKGSVPPSSHVPEPEQFTRGPLTAGHERPSPGDKSGNNPTMTVASGAVRSYYGARAQDAVRNAIANVHDHIAGRFPEICALAPTSSEVTPAMGASNTLGSVSPLSVPKAPGEKDEVADLVKSLVAEHTSALRDQYEHEIALLKAEIDELGKQPDPAQAPPRGAVRKSAVVEDARPVDRAVEDAQQRAARERAEYVAYLTSMTKSGDPTLRQDAESVLLKYLAS